MTLLFDEILATLCTSVSPLHSNEFQKAYVLATAIEAKLAFDLLVAYGLDVKLYPHDGDAAKLYITLPDTSEKPFSFPTDAAQAYAESLKRIKETLDRLQSSAAPTLAGIQYTMTFANLQPNGKQIVIQLAPPVSDTAASAPSAKDTIAASAALPQARETVISGKKISKRIKARDAEDDFTTGPSVAREKYPRKIAAKAQAKEESWLRQQMLYLFGTATLSSFAFFMMIIGIAVIFSLFVAAKAFLCPDFASMQRSVAWYCKSPGEVDENERKKAQREQRQRQIGLQPTEQ